MKKILALALVCLTGFTNVALAAKLGPVKMIFQVMKEQGFKLTTKMEDSLLTLKEYQNVTLDQANALIGFIQSRNLILSRQYLYKQNGEFDKAVSDEIIQELQGSISKHLTSGSPITLPKGSTTVFRDLYEGVSRTDVSGFTYRGGEAQKAAEAIANFGKPAKKEIPDVLVDGVIAGGLFGTGALTGIAISSSSNNRILDKSAVMPASNSAGKSQTTYGNE